MKKPQNTFRSIILFLILNSVVINAYSISISTRRLYLDPNSDSTYIRVHNMEASFQKCEVQLKDVVINNQGQIALVNNGEPTTNSAKPLVRLAPRRFNLAIGEHQMVKLLYRRKPGINSGEFHGVVAIKCVEDKKQSTLPVTIVPALVHNVPVIVRTGKLPIQAEFTAIQRNANKLQIELKIEGERSITGNLTVINADSDEVVAERKHLSIYAQQPVKNIEFLLDESQNSPLIVKFAEDPNMGGNLVIQQPVN